MGYIPNYSHLVGIMIINHWVFWATLFSDKPILEAGPSVGPKMESETIHHIQLWVAATGPKAADLLSCMQWTHAFREVNVMKWSRVENVYALGGEIFQYLCVVLVPYIFNLRVFLRMRVAIIERTCSVCFVVLAFHRVTLCTLFRPQLSQHATRVHARCWYK